MSLKSLPILFLNLGGEMLYILNQRLKAQDVPFEKSTKVMRDILGTMLNKRFMEELFKPQDAYSKKAMRTVFDRVAHASIMRLNSASMDKLYDLMTMVLKYQILLSKHPYGVLMVTLNHLDEINKFACGDHTTTDLVENVYSLMKEHYSALPAGELQLMRHTLLAFFQDMHIRVSLFLKDNSQQRDGQFVLPQGGKVAWGVDTPGTIRTFDEKGKETSVVHFDTVYKYQLADKIGSFEPLADRMTILGKNMYTNQTLADATVSSGPTVSTPQPLTHHKDSTNKLASTELNLLQYLISGENREEMAGFRLNLFRTDEEETQAEVEYCKLRHEEIYIDATKPTCSKEINQLMKDFSVEEDQNKESSKGDDLLALMDDI